MAKNQFDDVREKLVSRYPGFWKLPLAERIVLVMAFLSDDIEVREKGRNRGLWVEKFQAITGAGPGTPWCASAIAWACDCAKAQRPSFGAASVSKWAGWSRITGTAVKKPKRGDICYWLNANGTGHIGVVVRAALGFVWSIEGNTSAGVSGSQRDGDGLYRRVRRASKWEGFIRL